MTGLRALLRPPGFALPLLLAAGLLSFWYADRGLPLHDEGAQLTAAAKILRGGVFYRDIDTYPFPAAAYALAGAMALFGEHLSVARALAGALFCASVLVLYAAALAVLRPAGAALFALSLLTLKFLAWPAFSVYIYSDFAFAFACGALALLLHHRFAGPTRALALAGLFAGVAVTAKQSLGLYLVLAAATGLAFPSLLGLRAARETRLREFALFGLGAAVPLLVMSAWFASHGLLDAMLHSGLVRPFTGYLPTSGIPFSPLLRWWQLGSLGPWSLAPYVPLDLWTLLMREQLPGVGLYPLYWRATEVGARLVYTSLPLAFAWALLRRLRPAAGKEPREARVAWLAWLALAFVASAFPRADWFHVISVWPVVGLLLLALAESRAPSPRALRIGAAALAGALALSLALAGLLRSHLTARVELERASVAVHPEDAWVEPMIRQVERELPPGAPLFVHGIEADFYFLSGRFFPWPFSQLYPGMQGADGGAELARLLLRLRPAIVIQGVQRWPGVPQVASFAPRVSAAVRANYGQDVEFFARHAPEHLPPRLWVAQVLRPRGAARRAQ